jgi:HlyD family secretion protein
MIARLSPRLFSPPIAEVDVAPVSAVIPQPRSDTLAVRGFIVPHHRINVNSKVTGRVAWIDVEKGDRVDQGQELVRLEDDEFRAQVQEAEGALANAQAYLQQLTAGPRPEEVRRAEHAVEQARISMLNDEIALDRTRKLVTEGVLPREALDNVRTRFEGGKEQVQYLEQSLQLIKRGPREEEIARAKASVMQVEGQLAFARSQLEATVIRAPISGTILERTAEKGELITAQFASGAEDGPQGSVVAIADLRDLRVTIDIPQSDFGRLRLKQTTSITVDAFPERTYEGRIVEISPEADSQKATVPCRVQILRPDSRLRPRMNATVRFLSESPQVKNPAASAVLVPSSAIFERAHRQWTVVAAGGTAHLREVQVLRRTPEGVLVQGLLSGESVVLSNPQDLKEGLQIRHRH